MPASATKLVGFPVKSMCYLMYTLLASITADTVDNNIERSLDYVLGDLGCNGSEKNLLECLPRHNCGLSSGIDEDAKVTCARKGTTQTK